MAGIDQLKHIVVLMENRSFDPMVGTMKKTDQMFLLFSWGGKEGTHTIANMNTSLLGGSTRPSLFW